MKKGLPVRPDGFHRTFLSLGSNMGWREENIRCAIKMLPDAGVRVERVSSFYRTEPVELREQRWFVNCAIEATTTLPPARLLRATRAIEKKLGRERTVAKGPRPIDIDILFYENRIVRSRTIEIPHPRLGERRFVLIPLAEIAPEWRDPLSRRSVGELLSATRDRSRVVKIRDSGAKVRQSFVGNRPLANEK